MENNFDREYMGQEPENNPENQKRIDSIPLWLQGIAENSSAANAADEESENDEWQKEQTMESKQDTGPVSLELTDQILPEEDVLLDADEADADSDEDSILPDWVSELKEPSDEEKIKTFPGIATTPFDEVETETEDDQEDENTEEVPPDVVDDPDGQDETITEIEQAAPEDDIDAERSPSFDDEAIAEDEEIPSWLQEMIAADEKQQKQSWSQPQKSADTDEPTQPVSVKQADGDEPLPDEIKIDQERPAAEAPFSDTDEIEEKPENPTTPAEDVPSGPPSRPAVMPTANWSRLADLPEQAEEPEEIAPDTDPDTNDEEAFTFETFNDTVEPEEAPEAEPQAEGELVEEEEAEPFSPDTYSKQFEGTGFKPIEFEPANSEPVEEPEFEEENLISEAFEAPAPVDHLELPPVEQPFTHTDQEFKVESPESEDIAPETPNEAPTTLAQAKQLLDQGEVNQALPIIRSHIDREENLDVIKEWLLVANDKIKKNKAEILEALGDIASLEGDFSSALSAYAKAIDYLELARKNIE